MKTFIIALFMVAVTGCSTTAGAIKGLGEDVKGGTDTVSNWFKPANPPAK